MMAATSSTLTTLLVRQPVKGVPLAIASMTRGETVNLDGGAHAHHC